MKSKLIGFVAGVVVGATIFGSVALATSTEFRNLYAAFCGITIEIDNEQFTPTDVTGKEVEPFIVDGTTYLPIRAISEAFDKEVIWDADQYTVCIFTKSEPVTEEEIEEAFAEVYLSDDTLVEYTIDEIEFVRGNNWMVFFSVLPEDDHFDEWLVGNGEEGEDGWIVEKMLLISVIKIDDVIDLQILGTGL